jgi:hypothetical protein
MRDVDAAGADRTVVAVLTQYGMATTEQLHLLLALDARIQQTRRRLLAIGAKGFCADQGMIDGAGK